MANISCAAKLKDAGLNQTQCNASFPARAHNGFGCLTRAAISEVILAAAAYCLERPFLWPINDREVLRSLRRFTDFSPLHIEPSMEIVSSIPKGWI
jgi:hypothetical protein